MKFWLKLRLLLLLEHLPRYHWILSKTLFNVNYQFIGFIPLLIRYWLVFEKGLLPKKPR